MSAWRKVQALGVDSSDVAFIAGEINHAASDATARGLSLEIIPLGCDSGNGGYTGTFAALILIGELADQPVSAELQSAVSVVQR